MSDKPKAGDLETRSTDLAAEGKKIRGVVPYGTESRDMGGWREVIEATALRNAKLDDLVATVDHAGVPLARYPTTLALEDRSDGLHWSLEPPQSRVDVLEAIERGDLRAGSWRMRVARDEWRGDVRHVHEIAELRDVSVVTAPSYEAAAVEYRSRPSTPTAADERQEKSMDDNKKTALDSAKKLVEDGVKQYEEPAEERSAPEVKVKSEPAPQLEVEQRTEAPKFHGLADAYAQRGFFENRSASVTWDEYRAVTWSAGTVLTDLNPTRQQQAALGYDRRWTFPVVPQTSVDEATTSVQYVSQSSRAIPAGTAIVRPLDSVTTKPEVGGTVELQSLQLSQVAGVVSNVPRILGAQPIFGEVVEQDLTITVNEGLDHLVRTGLATAGTAAAVTGNVLDKIRKARTVVEAEGYNPDTVVIDPAGAEGLDLLKSAGTEELYVFQPGSGAPSGPWGLNVRVSKTAGTAVFDSAAFGRLYASPVELRAFEQDAGATNRQTYRMELNGGFAVERLPAALRIV